MPRIVAALLLGSLLGACAYSYNVGVKAVDGSTVALMPGQSATLADGLLRYIRLSSDSRCKPGVQCVWAGDAVIALRWTPATGDAQDFELHTMPRQRAFVVGKRTITLQALERGDAPRATLQVQ